MQPLIYAPGPSTLSAEKEIKYKFKKVKQMNKNDTDSL